MSREEKMQISLTGENSHSVHIPLGQGSFSIGTMGMDAGKFDVLVDNDSAIDWDCFNSFYTGSGRENPHLFPYGDWPRFFYYWGNDTNFIKWSEKRKIEDFTWCPDVSVSVDFTKSNINRLFINAENHQLHLKLGNHSLFSISGDIANAEISKIGKIDSISFSPKTDKDEGTSYPLPVLGALSEISSVDIHVNPVGQAFDCKSLLQFTNLTSLNLSGNLTHLRYLEQLEKLEHLAIRYAPNLEDLPSLKSWGKLTSFIGWNIEESKGKSLRSELRNLAKERELKYSSVSQLRKSIWYTTEYNMPFSAWKGKNAKLAVKTYKASLKKLKKAKEETEVKELLTEFTKAFNNLPEIETTEREDIGEAIDQLRQIPTVKIDAKKATQWFDEVRDY